MTIQERLEFIRAGYTRADIEAFESGAQEPTNAEEQQNEQEPSEHERQNEQMPDDQEHDAPAWASALKASIDALTKVTQTRNALFDDMGDASDTASKAQRALATYLTGKEEK